MTPGIMTYLFIGITAITSISAFSNTDLLNRLILYPALMKENNEWWRLITNGFIHADWVHLFFNMFTLYFFGRAIEFYFAEVFENAFVFPAFYLSALVFSSTPSYAKHKNHSYYRSLGASGAVSAVLFASIIFNPWAKIGLMFAIQIPGILFAVLYLMYSSYMSKKGGDNINHDAHLYGALYGLLFPIVFKPQLISYFLEQIQHPHF